MKAQTAKSFKRRKQGKTNYQRRLGLLKSRKSRLIVRKSLKNIRVQLIGYEQTGDKILASAFSGELKKLGWTYNCGSLPAAYLTGMLCGSKAVKAGEKEAVLDIGTYEPINKCKLYAALKGALDAGLKLPYNEKALPDENRLTGAHIAAHAGLLKKDNKEAFDKQFSGYLKNKQDPEQIQKTVETIKAKILGGKS
jgi:large subunit ribosomal protein L18